MAAASRTVLIAVDASEHSREAFEWFFEFIYQPSDILLVCHIPEAVDLSIFNVKWYLHNVFRPDDLIVVCHVPEQPHLSMFSLKDGLNIPVEEWQKAIQEQLERIKKLEQDYEGDLIAKKIQYKMKVEQHKNPGEGIISTAEGDRADLIVMGTRGLDPIRRTLLGSVSDYVVRHSRVPVLVCPKRH